MNKLMFQLYTYEIANGGIAKTKDTDRFVELLTNEKTNEKRVAKILIETGILPQNENCEYMVDNQNAAVIYVDKDGLPFCELRQISVH